MWSNKRLEGFIEERLDRFVATEDWRSIFPIPIAEYVIWDGFDHSPIILYPKAYMENRSQNSREEGRIFRFEVRWTHHEDRSRKVFGEL